jgi:hypothetical protein
VRSRVAVAVVLAVAVLAGGGRASALDLSAVTLQLGAPVAASGSQWSGGSLSGSVALDLRGRGAVTPVALLGSLRGLEGGDQYERNELSCEYLVAAARFTSRPLGAARAYLLIGGGLLRADNRASIYIFGSGRGEIVQSANTGATALVAAGAILALPASRVAIVVEVAALVPSTSVPAPGRGDVGRQLVASAGVRVPLVR